MSEALRRAENNQRRAADPAASAFVTANAGSGKTKVLIDRVARLLLRGEAPSSLLCITYTKAAAAEMRRRLFERLGTWCVAPNDKLTAELSRLSGGERGIEAGELDRARSLFARALETPGGLRIQTIHSFCERLLRRFPLEAQVSPGFTVLEEAETEALMARAWSEAIDDPAAAAALARLASQLDEGRLEDLVAALNARRRDLAAALHGRGLAGALAALRKRHGAHASRDAFLNAFLAETPWRDLLAGCALLETGRATDQTLAERLRAAAAAEAEAAFDILRELYLKQDDAPRATLMTKALRDADPALCALLAREQQRVAAGLAARRAIDRAEDCAALLTLGDRLLGAYQRAKGATGALDFEDLIERADTLLNNSGAAPWVLYKLDGRINHILVDEGQDTSPAQWNLLAPLQEEFFAGVGAHAHTRTVFAVGDAKQSIYSFQGADAARFLAQAQQLSARAAAAALPFHAPDLTMSFRSTPTVLAAVDSVFEALPLTTEPAGSIAIRHEASRSDHGGLVELWPLAPRPEREEPNAWTDPVDSESARSAAKVMAEAIARRIAMWIAEGAQVWGADGVPRAMRAGDVIALVRTRGGVFDALLKAFKSAGLAVAGADRMLLRDEIAVQDLLSFARVALDPTDDLSLASALKSPLIGLDDDDLMTLAAERQSGETVLSRLRADGRYAAAAAFVNTAIAAGAVPTHEFFARLLEAPDEAGISGWRRIIERLGPAARDPLEELLNRALIARGQISLQHFVCALEADEAPIKREMEAGQDAVRVMTAHGAKGLEAPVIVLADTTGGFENSDSGLLSADGELYWSPKKKEDDAATQRVRQGAREAARREHFRLLYVAMTRARDRLIVCGHERGNVAGGRAAECWHEAVEQGLAKIASPCETPFGEGLRVGQDSRFAAAPAPPLHARAAPAWLGRPAPRAPTPPPLAPSRLTAERLPGFSARALERKRFHRGRLIHGLLQRLPDMALAERRGAGAAWLRARMAPGEDANALLDEALRVLSDPRFAAVFGPGSRAEAPLAGDVAGRRVSGVIDRLLIGPEEILVLDFKTDRPAPPSSETIPEAYLLQLGLYRALLRKAIPGRAVRCALIWTEAPLLSEASAAAMDQAVAAALVEA